MMPDPNSLSDPFFSQRLNPLFLSLIKQYWDAVSQAKESSASEIKTAKLNLLRFLFRRLFQPLYLNLKQEINGSVFFFTCVSSDGLGDYYTLLKSAQALKQAHPQLDIQIVFTHERELPEIEPSAYLLESDQIHAFRQIPEQKSRILSKVLERKDIEDFDQELQEIKEAYAINESDFNEIVKKNAFAASAIKETLDDLKEQKMQLEHYSITKRRAEDLYEKLKNSLAIVHVSLALNTFENPELSAKSFYFAEAGNFQGIANYFQYNWHSMGLLPFEEGIFLKTPNAKPSLSWQSQEATVYLWKKTSIENYLQNHALYLCYLTKNQKQKEIYLYLVCMLQKEDSKTIDIAMTPFPSEKPLLLNAALFASLGIGTIILFENGKEKDRKTLDVPGKTLRLLCTLPVPAQDFANLLHLSNPLVGCTGDLSLGESIMAEKIPFYEIRKHKIETFQAFHMLAKFLQLDVLVAYFEEFAQIPEKDAAASAESFYEIIIQTAFQNEWKTLIEFIKRHCCFEDSLLSHLNRHFIFLKKPELKEKEEELIMSFLERKNSAEEIYSLFETKIFSAK